MSCGEASWSICFTLIRKSTRWCVFTQAWGYIAITSYLVVFKFACLISRGFGLLLNKLYYNCLSYILTLHIKKLCKIKVTLDLLYQAMFLCNSQKLCGCDDTHQDIFFFWGCRVSQRKVVFEGFSIVINWTNWRVEEFLFYMTTPCHTIES